MKYLDKVKVINDRNEYKKKLVFKNMCGTIIDAEIRDDCFHIVFIDERIKDVNFMKNDDNLKLLKDDILCPIKIDDLEFVEDGNCPDEWILDGIPNHSPKWWCKVENGYILNLLGEKKNKIPYDYNS